MERIGDHAVDIAELAMQRLERFAENASRALSIGSVFYMYALLYPDNHIKGEPNDLDLLAEAIQERLSLP